jgi:hypothetical protein
MYTCLANRSAASNPWLKTHLHTSLPMFHKALQTSRPGGIVTDNLVFPSRCDATDPNLS